MQVIKMLAAIVAVPIAFFAGTREAAKFASLSRKSGGAFREIRREWKEECGTIKSIFQKED